MIDWLFIPSNPDPVLRTTERTSEQIEDWFLLLRVPVPGTGRLRVMFSCYNQRELYSDWPTSSKKMLFFGYERRTLIGMARAENQQTS